MRAHSKMVLHDHGMVEVGVRFSMGPQVVFCHPQLAVPAYGGTGDPEHSTNLDSRFHGNDKVIIFLKVCLRSSVD